MLTLYKVGHQQFYLPWVFMVAALPLANRQSADRMAIILLPAVLLLSLFSFGYEYASDHYRDELRWVRAYGGGLIAFVVSISIAAYVLTASAEHSEKASAGNPLRASRKEV